MEEKVRQFPLYIKITCMLSSLVIVFYALYILQDIFIPFAIASLFAVLLNPLVKKMEKYMPRILAISLTVFLVIVLVWIVIFFISQQFSVFNDNLPALQQKFSTIFKNRQTWLQSYIDISPKQEWDLLNQITSWSTALLAQTIWWIYNLVIFCVIVPFYVFLLLLYKPLIVEFILNIFSSSNPLQIVDILEETKSSVQSYIFWLLIETFLVATLNSIALMIIGVKYAILLWILWGIINILPYIGWIAGTLMPMFIALLTNEPIIVQVYIIVSYLFIQFVDNNFLLPYVVSSKLQINALFSILIVLLAAALWWVAWMFLAVPFLWVLKIIFDRVDGYKHIGKLLWTEIPTKPFFLDRKLNSFIKNK